MGETNQNQYRMADQINDVDRRVSAMEARQTAVEQRMDRMQTQIAEAQAEAKADAQRIYTAINDVRQSVTRQNGAAQALKWVTGTAVAVGAATVAYLKGGV